MGRALLLPPFNLSLCPSCSLCPLWFNSLLGASCRCLSVVDTAVGAAGGGKAGELVGVFGGVGDGSAA